MVRNCSLFLRKFSTPLVCFHIPPSLLSAHLLWHWIAVSPGDSQVTCLERWPLTGCTAASQGHAARLVPPVPQTTGPEAAFNDVTFSTYCEVACVCFDLLFIQLLFHLILSSVPIPSPISPKKKILPYWFPSTRLLWQVGIRITLISKTKLFDECLWLEK